MVLDSRLTRCESVPASLNLLKACAESYVLSIQQSKSGPETFWTALDLWEWVNQPERPPVELDDGQMSLEW